MVEYSRCDRGLAAVSWDIMHVHTLFIAAMRQRRIVPLQRMPLYTCMVHARLVMQASVSVRSLVGKRPSDVIVYLEDVM